ncbi:MAG: tetratricopeptide repeat protein [Agriterribacter sp.]
MSYRKEALTTLFLFLFCCGFISSAVAQKDATLDVKKPEKYEKRILGSDKTFTTKYTIPRRLLQSMSTHYNFFFNGEIKLNDVIAGAKQAFRDDFTELLPFYNYTIEATAAQKTELDSVLQKCNAAILLHDLRNEWIDDMYFLMGKAYFFKNQMDSAGITFQYLNYYFQPKKEEELGFKKFVGSNLNDEGSVYDISTKEKRGVVQKVFSEPPRRNDALIWLVRTYIEDSAYGEASGLIQTLKRDQLMPERLKPFFEEMQAYWFYKHNMWDSAAIHLIPALENAENSAEKARGEYLTGQLFALAKNKTEANKYFDLSIKHAIDPVMMVYARLNQIKLANGNDDKKVIEDNIRELLKMAKRDRYYNYRSIIYYMAAQMEMERDNFDGATTWLLKSVTYNPEDLTQKNRSYLYLGDIAFEHKQYELAAKAYDSLDAGSPLIKNPEEIGQRKAGLAEVISRLKTISTQDSLQKIAAMPEAEREKFLKAAVKRLGKERGLKETDSTSFSSNNPYANKGAGDMFAANGKGDWYFYNNSLKSKGFSTFRSTWGTRPNVDNWRRITDVSAQSKSPNINPGASPVPLDQKEEKLTDISYDGLLKTLPLTPEALTASNDSIENALFSLGKIFKDKFEDYTEAIKKYEDLLNRYPNTPYQEEAIFDLNYCYTKLNLPVKAKQYRELLAKNFQQSKYLRFIDDPKSAQESINKLQNDATKNYERIYNLFLEGNFEQAVIEKIKADSLFGNVYWTQQLLYIESIYYIKQRDDSSAINALRNLIKINAESGMAKKAENIIDVLRRRASIEKYLTDLNIERATEDSTILPEEKKLEKIAEKQPEPQLKTPGKEQVAQRKPEPKTTDITAPKETAVRPVIDSSLLKKPVVKQSGFTYNPSESHFVAIVLNKVDVVYVNEVRNAFSRYNRESYRAQPIEMSIETLDDNNKLVLMSDFADAAAALEYVERTKKVAGAQIVPWLAADKYYLTIISPANLEVLRTNKNLDIYKNFVQSNYPGQ